MDDRTVAVHEGRACGKVILFGEHAVVYGEPAIATGIARGAFAQVSPCDAPSTLQIHSALGEPLRGDGSEIESAFHELSDACGVRQNVRASVALDLPVRAGLGSSAALGVSLARAMLSVAGAECTLQRVIDAALVWERVFHSNPSGIDVHAAAHGGVIAFERAKGMEPLGIGYELLLCIGHCGRGSSTKWMVNKVAQFRARQPDLTDQIMHEIGALVRAARVALASGDLPTLGKLMNLNHTLLSSLSVSTDALDRLCGIARAQGALGAKLTGAGGGGCVVALAPAHENEVLGAWEAEGFKGFVTGVAG